MQTYERLGSSRPDPRADGPAEVGDTTLLSAGGCVSIRFCCSTWIQIHKGPGGAGPNPGVHVPAKAGKSGLLIPGGSTQDRVSCAGGVQIPKRRPGPRPYRPLLNSEIR